MLIIRWSAQGRSEVDDGANTLQGTVCSTDRAHERCCPHNRRDRSS
jgi:hypothetical protein